MPSQSFSKFSVESGRGFVLHSADFHLDNATLPISEELSLTATLDVLKATADARPRIG